MPPNWNGDEISKLTPFDYDFDEESEALIRIENFVVNCAWAADYSSDILGVVTRPALAAVAYDIIALVDFLDNFVK